MAAARSSRRGGATAQPRPAAPDARPTDSHAPDFRPGDQEVLVRHFHAEVAQWVEAYRKEAASVAL